MEVKEAARRILWHYKLLIAFVVIGGMASLVLKTDGGPTYVASTRLVVGTDLDATAAADSVAGIATSQARVEEVLSNAGIDRDPGTVADRVSVSPIGSSDVVELSARDTDPVVAVDIAKGLSTQVIEVMRQSGLAEVPLPYVVDTASLSTTRAVSTNGVQNVALGALVGLILGILLTALLEAIGPTIIGGDAIAAELRGPLLGVVRHWPRIDDQTMAWLSWQVGAGARRLRVKTIEVTTVDPLIDVRPLASSLSASAESQAAPQPPRIRSLAADGIMPVSANGSTGLVIVTPSVLKDADLEPARDLMAVTGWRAIGIIAVERRGVPRWLLRMRPTRRRPSEDDLSVPPPQPRSLRSSGSG